MQQNWSTWLESLLGKRFYQWHRRVLEQELSHHFGYYACQIQGVQLPVLEFCRTRQVMFVSDDVEQKLEGYSTVYSGLLDWPFPDDSLDVVVYPMSLSDLPDPTASLREAYRCLHPEGKVLITGFNPYSFWGLRHYLRQTFLGKNWLPVSPLPLPRLKDWLVAIGFEPAAGQQGCYQLPFAAQAKNDWIEAAGDRWWPACSGAYVLVGVKRSYDMLLINKHWKRGPKVWQAQLNSASNSANETPRS